VEPHEEHLTENAKINTTENYTIIAVPLLM
jgi:hypothetical protein